MLVPRSESAWPRETPSVCDNDRDSVRSESQLDSIIHVSSKVSECLYNARTWIGSFARTSFTRRSSRRNHPVISIWLDIEPLSLQTTQSSADANRGDHGVSFISQYIWLTTIK